MAHREKALPPGVRVLIDHDGAHVDGDFADDNEEIFASNDLRVPLRDALRLLGIDAEIIAPGAPVPT